MRAIVTIIYMLYCTCCYAQQADSAILNSIPPGPIQVAPPTYVSTKVDTLDAAYLRVNIFTNSYCIYLFKDSLCTSDTVLIDNFIAKRIDLINKEKVFVIGDPNTRYENFKPLKNIFKKYELFRFKIVTDDATY